MPNLLVILLGTLAKQALIYQLDNYESEFLLQHDLGQNASPVCASASLPIKYLLASEKLHSYLRVSFHL